MQNSVRLCIMLQPYKDTRNVGWGGLEKQRATHSRREIYTSVGVAGFEFSVVAHFWGRACDGTGRANASLSLPRFSGAISYNAHT